MRRARGRRSTAGGALNRVFIAGADIRRLQGEFS